jgi:hypothetical protein
VSVYYWFFSNSEFFHLLKKHKNANPVYLFFLTLLFISYPAILALSYKITWDYFDENAQVSAFLVSLIPIVIFMIGVVILKKIKSL